MSRGEKKGGNGFNNFELNMQVAVAQATAALTWKDVVRSTTPSSSMPLSLVRSTTEDADGVLDPELSEMGR